MNYQQTLNWMFQRLPNYQERGKEAYSNKLEPIIAFCEHLNRPQNSFKSIHIAGTNGKGSSSHMLSSILQQAGYKVGLYTSPHLKDFRERIKICGQMISQDELIEFIQSNKSYIETHDISFFELTVALAYDCFNKHKVDIAIIEVGLGGRLDATNIIDPEVSLITNIGYDHKDVLGNTLLEIASEKAGIIKANTPIVISEYQEEIWDVFQNRATSLNAPIYLAKKTNFKSDLKGSYQPKNTNGVVEVLKHLEGFKITQDHIKQGLLSVVKNTHLLGRWQIQQKSPKVILDTAHNKEGLTYTLKQLKQEQKQTLRIVFGMVEGKDIDGVLELLPRDAIYYLCRPQNFRALKVNTLQELFKQKGLKNNAYSTVAEALDAAKKDSDQNDVIYVGGSTFVVAEVV